MAGEFPVLFTVGNSNRHEVILLSPTIGLKNLSSKVQKLVVNSPNCVEALAKYSKQKSSGEVIEVKVRWSGEPRYV